MMEETATVTRKDGYYVWVETAGRSGCSSCGVQGSCGTSMLSGLFKPRRNQFRIFDPFNLQAGDQVVLGLEPRELLRAAFYAYLMPLLLMVVMSSMASNEGFAEGAVMAIGLFSLAAGMFLMRLVGRQLRGGLARVFILGRVGEVPQDKIQFINLQGKTS
jgi:sigma-E factor negative regulatory protein RseC